MNPDAEMVAALRKEARCRADELNFDDVEAFHKHQLTWLAADLIESQSSRIAELERQLLQADTDYELERVAYRALERDLAAAREDAERYRWLRENNVLSHGGGGANPETLDALIDRSIDLEEKGG